MGTVAKLTLDDWNYSERLVLDDGHRRANADSLMLIACLPYGLFLT